MGSTWRILIGSWDKVFFYIEESWNHFVTVQKFLIGSWDNVFFNIEESWNRFVTVQKFLIQNKAQIVILDMHAFRY